MSILGSMPKHCQYKALVYKAIHKFTYLYLGRQIPPHEGTSSYNNISVLLGLSWKHLLQSLSYILCCRPKGFHFKYLFPERTNLNLCYENMSWRPKAYALILTLILDIGEWPCCEVIMLCLLMTEIKEHIREYSTTVLLSTGTWIITV